MWLVIVGICIHLVFFYSIFDIYFTSPLVHGMPTFATAVQPPAKRLVLFVADGLRADKFYELDAEGISRAPYLRSIIMERGSWGVSHTRVPTESRPGHVALIAGFYEDVSAVAKGWKENPVEFDSVFNESRSTWSWGSPDILPMFAKGATGDHVVTHCYEAEREDFAAKNLSQLDTWVFDRVKEFLSKAKDDSSLYEKLTKDKIVFFLHLLGLDTNGHSNKPYSDDYLDNIKVVDAGIRDIEGLIEEFYEHDGKTSYVMTSDHGMTNWGSHGAGHPSETLTPLVVWGAGASLPQPSRKEEPLYNDPLSQEWKLNDLRRIDVEQADVAALMTALIGIPFPVNNVGTVPIDYLSTSDFFKAESLYTNAKQMLSQYRVKQIERESTTLTSTFRPFRELSASVETDMVRNIRQLLRAGRYQDAIHESRLLIALSLKGLNYYHNYNRLFLGTWFGSVTIRGDSSTDDVIRASIVLGFLGWMAYILALALQEYSGLVTKRQVNTLTSGIFFIIFSIVGLVITALLYVQQSPWIYYLYCLLPLPLWLAATSRLGVFVNVMQNIQSQKSCLANSMTVILTVAGLEVIVLGFFVRELFSVGLLCMAGWIHSSDLWKANKRLCVQWVCGCLVLAAFPMLPVVGGNAHYTLVLLGGCAFTWIGVACIYRPHWLGIQAGGGGGIRQGSNFFFANLHLFLILVQVVCLAMSVCIIRSTSQSIATKQGLPLLNQILSWTILCVSLVLPLVGSKHILSRLISIGMSLAAPYILLSTSHEALFLLSLSAVLYIWLQLEFDMQTGPKPYQLEELDFGRSAIRLGSMTERNLSSTDLRRAYFFIFLILTAFFGTGNIASINSFDPASVYSFLTVFNPFVMGALMLSKIIIPFILVTCVFRAIHIITHLPTRAFFFIMMLLSDAMALNFFLLVRDHGSWLDIGTSISHYVIVMCMCIFLQVLLGIAHILTGWSLRRPRSHQF